MGKINLKDIAERSGVSISTVSRVINDPDQVNIETREAVYQVMRELGYRRSLKKNENRQGKGAVALITSHSDSEFFMDFIIALQQELASRNLYPLLIDTREEESLSLFLSRNSSWADLVDAAIVFFCHIDEIARDFFKEHNIPVAAVHTRCPYFYAVMNNDYMGGYDAASFLWNKGYRSFGMVYWREDQFDRKSMDRKLGFLRFLEEKGIPFSEQKQLQYSDISLEGGYRATAALLERYSPDAVFYACDTMAIGGMEYCREKGISIPEEVALMGFDDIRMAEAMNLSTMNQFIPAKARSVSNHILQALEGALPGEFPEEVTITPIVVERQTS